MPELTRRRSREAHQECWHIYYGDVRVGTITERAGVPHDVDQWGWQCGFYPLTHRHEHAEGTAASFNQARDAFGRNFRRLLNKMSGRRDVMPNLRRCWVMYWKLFLRRFADRGTDQVGARPRGVE